MSVSGSPSRRTVLKLGAAIALAGPAAARAITTSIDPAALSPRKHTPLGLYLTPQEAHNALSADPEILFVDVRDPIEISFVGHPAGLDKIIPLGIMTHQIDPDSGQYRMTQNPNLVSEFNLLLSAKGKTKEDTVFVTCRSGARSAVATRMLSEAGYSNVWNLIEGFEGDRDANGIRSMNGWRNAGLPWAYHLEPDVAWARPG